MMYVDLDEEEEGRELSALDGRYVYVGVGQFGQDVLERLGRSLKRRAGCIPALTDMVPISLAAIHVEAAPDFDRREFHAAFAGQEKRDAVCEDLRAAIERCAAMLPMGLMPTAISNEICVYVIADLCDSFASAVICDVAHLVAAAAAARRHTVIGLFRLCPAIDQRARACAVLRELEFELGQDARPPSNIASREKGNPLAQCFLVGDSNRKGKLVDYWEQVAVVGRFLIRFCRPFRGGTAVAADSGMSKPQLRFAALGLSSAYFPQKDVQNYCLAQWCAEACKLLAAKAGDEPRCSSGAAPPIPPLHAICEDIGLLLSKREDWPPELEEVPIEPLRRSILASHLLSEWCRLEGALRGLRVDTDDIALLTETRKALVDYVESLVERQFGGLAAAREQLAELEATVSARIQEAEEQQASYEADAATSAMMDALREAEAQPDVDPREKPKPPWHRVLCRWDRREQIRRVRRELSVWVGRTMAYMARSRDALVEWKVWDTVTKGFEALAGAIRDQKRCVDALHEGLTSGPPMWPPEPERGSTEEPQWSVPGRAAPTDTGCRSVPTEAARELWRAVPKAVRVDRSILPTSRYKDFYARFVRDYAAQANPDMVSQLLDTHKVLAGYRTLTPAELGKRIAAAARSPEFGLMRVSDMELREQIELAGLAPEHLQLQPWLSRDLWEYAEPLTKVCDEISPGELETRAQFCILQAPDVGSLTQPPAPWPYSPNPPNIISGSQRSVHLCRVLHGFTLSSLDLLGVCREAYLGSADPQRLHTVGDIGALPTLAG